MPTRTSMTIDKDLMLQEFYNNVALPIVKEIFASSVTDESPNYIIPAWKAEYFLLNFNNNFESLPDSAQIEIKQNFEKSLEKYVEKL